MNNITRYTIEQDGSIYRVVTSKQLVDANQAVVDALCANAPRRATDLLDINGKRASLSLVGQHAYWCVQLPSITLRATFHLDSQGVLTPNFAGLNGDPVLALPWSLAGARLSTIIRTYKHNTDVYLSDCAWLVAQDERSAIYRLPLANLYDDAKLCLGNYDSRATTHLGVVTLTLAQLERSRWNQDLWTSAERTAQMFRWKPKDSGFELLAPVAPWTTLANKIAPSIQPYIL